MAAYNASSRYFENGLEVDRQQEGLQHNNFDRTGHAGLQHKEPYESQRMNTKGEGGTRSRRNPFGLHPCTFGLIVALITLIVVGAAVGGGVGGALSSSHHSSSSGTMTSSNPTFHTMTVTQTISASSSASSSNLFDYTVADPQNVTTVGWDCPGLTTYTTVNVPTNQKFNVTCGIDYENSIPANEGGTVADILGIVAYSAADCMEACASFNFQQSLWQNSSTCAGITFDQQMSNVYDQLGANCFLKNGTSINPVVTGQSLSAAMTA